MACLEQCALEFFILRPGDDAPAHRSDLALLLYKKLLGLELPYSYVAPSTRLDIAPLKTNLFLWLNYLSLLALHSQRDGSFVQLESGFSMAMELVPLDKNFAIQTEYVESWRRMMFIVCVVFAFIFISLIRINFVSPCHWQAHSALDHEGTREWCERQCVQCDCFSSRSDQRVQDQPV